MKRLLTCAIFIWIVSLFAACGGGKSTTDGGDTITGDVPEKDTQAGEDTTAGEDTLITEDTGVDLAKDTFTQEDTLVGQDTGIDEGKEDTPLEDTYISDTGGQDTGIVAAQAVLSLETEQPGSGQLR